MTAVSPGHLILAGLEGPELTTAEAEVLRRHELAGVVLFPRNVVDADQLHALCDAIAGCATQESPPLVVADHEGGSVASLRRAIGTPPSALALGIAEEVGLTERVHAETAARARSVGIDMLLGPVADVTVTGNPVIATRSFGTEAVSVLQHVRAAVRGQRRGGVLSCVKHWPGHGRTRTDSHEEVASVEASIEALLQTDIPPFVAALRDGVEAIMVGHLAVPCLDATRLAPVSSEIVRGWLRQRLGYEGVILTDALEMHGFASASPGQALAAGCDLLLFARPVTALSSELGRLSEEMAGLPMERVRDARERIRSLRGFSGSPAPTGPGRGGDLQGVYGEARERGAVVLWPEGSSAPVWPPQTDSGTWSLLDAASGDRLVREEMGRRDAPPAQSVLRPALEERLGPARQVHLVAPPPTPVDLGSAQSTSGWIVATVRPWPAPVGRAVASAIARTSPQWIVLLGDAALQNEISSEIGLVLVPGTTVADAELLAQLLSGALSAPLRDRWGDPHHGAY